MRRFVLILCFLTYSIYTFAQQFQGKIVDEISGDAIPFVSIGVVGTNQATITNENGEFVFKNVIFPAKIRYSHISYLQLEQEFTSNPDKLIVKLKPAAIHLSEVSIDPFRGLKLIKAAIEKSLQHSNENHYAKSFYRQLTTVNGTANQIYELFYDLKLSPSGLNGWRAKQTRFAQSNEKVNFSISNQSYLTFSFATALFENKKSGKYVNLKNLKDFYISIDKYIEQSNQSIAVVSCKYKGNKKQHYINSTYYIGTEDFNVYKIESSIFNLPMNFNGSTAKIPPIATVISTFSKKEGEITLIESVVTKLYLSLNTGHQAINALVSSMLSVYEFGANLKTEKFNNVTKNVEDRATIESIAYSPEFWKDNPIVKQTALEDTFIKMMEKKSAFGTMINPL